jgi:hypothetical protein
MTSKKGAKATGHEVTRYIKRSVERELWARAAGRCQFSGCNEIVFKSPVTQERVNISQKAHIYSFSKNGPRGFGPFVRNKKELNEIGNLILVCHGCHSKIDKEGNEERYPAALLQAWKAAHEERVRIVTGIAANKKTHVVCYGANIGENVTRLSATAVANALFPDWYPEKEHPTRLSMTWEGRDNTPEYWATEERNLSDSFNRQIRPLIEDGASTHFSVFGLAPMPLLVKLGALFTDKSAVEVYQLHREPHQSWKWESATAENAITVKAPLSIQHKPVLLLSLSDVVPHERVHAVLGANVSIWEVTVERPNNDFLKSREQLSEYRRTLRRVISEIGEKHGKDVALSIFPAMPVACSVELGRLRMPKADSEWLLYDFSNAVGSFVPTITIGPAR